MTNSVARIKEDYSMINAKDARDYVQKQASEVTKRKLQTIEKIVLDAVEDGRTYCFIGIEITQGVAETLKSLGYRVEQTDERLYKISW